MKRLCIVILAAAVVFLAGCQKPSIRAEKHRDVKVQQDVSTEQAIQEAQVMDQTPAKIDSGPMEVHRETIVEKVESEEIVIE